MDDSRRDQGYTETLICRGTVDNVSLDEPWAD